MSKTNKDLLAAFAEKIGTATGNPLMKSSFEQQLLPAISGSKSIHNPISDAEYAARLAAFERDLPKIIEELKRRKISKPPTFEPKN
jgi:3-deoxy-D-arabino-heptulosonate 7-phosphate (DAHP) synthase